MSVRIVLGSILVILGGILLFDQLDLLDAGTILSIFWPSILIIAGIADLVQKPRNYLWSGVLILVGAILLLNSTGVVTTNIWGFVWPAILLLGGILILFNIGKGGYAKTSSDEGFSVSAIFSGREYKNASKNLKGGELVTVFGGADIDLRKSTSKETTIQLNATSIFGGAEIRVPESWNVEVNATPLFGGIENKTSINPANKTTLVISGVVLFGGIEIKD